MPGNSDKVLNSEAYIREMYSGIDIGKSTNDTELQEYLFPLENTLPVQYKFIPPKGRSSIATAILRRGRRFGMKQDVTFKVETDYAKYFDKYSALEVLFTEFLSYDIQYSKALDEGNDLTYLYVRRFHMQYLDNLPETMYYVHFVFTQNVNRWVRFKRLFAALDLNVDPVIISTVKFKFMQYLMRQRRDVVMIDTPGISGIVQDLSSVLLHKLIDMFVFMPYCYLFMVYKAMDLQNKLADGGGLLSARDFQLQFEAQHNQH